MTGNSDDFNADELQTPEWMNTDFFLKVLKNCEQKTSKIEIVNVSISPASMKGDHYASVIFRALLEFQVNGVRKTKSVILKTMPESDGHKKEMLGKTDIFEKEINMYTKVLPRFEKILRDSGDNTVLKVPCLYSALMPKKVIVFEDLVSAGYEVVRDRTLNEKEVKAAYAMLAKWHAISYKINLEEPQYFDEFQRGVFNMSNIANEPFMTSGIINFVDLLRKTPSLHAYLPYFEQLKPKLLESCRESYAEYRESPKEGACYVLSHGDFHGKNMMFKHQNESDEMVNVMLLDFQICYVGPNVNDLIYSIYCLLDENLRLDFPALLYYYYTIFKDTLANIGFKGTSPTLMQIRHQYMRHKNLELFLLVTFLPLWYALNEKADMEDMMTSDEYRRSLYNSKDYIKYLEHVLPRYLHLGYLEE
ncbi:uncharacterized protein [Bactrocera oleae]|uniref:uncharacterized protein n=1 Tax=Bactrocera oleae TaxID=104688 RepID=UPI0006B77FD6|nr:uncharacterized protein LOC106623187 [Bactrocera oleae]XP_036233225.1 uncharacterized protein LOC106623187 [Bactrocera oleae]